MNAIVEHKAQHKSVLVAMSDRYGMEPAAFEATVRATCMRPDKNGRVPSKEEFAAFLLVAKEYELNPLTKEIYAYAQKGGGIVPIVSIDGWINLINSHKAMDGMEFTEHHDQGGKLHAITCRIYRKDRSKPVEVTEHLSECYRETEPWKMKHRMLRHKALIQCARYAFGFAGIYDEDEAERIVEARDVTPVQEVSRIAPPPPPPPTTKAAEPEADEPEIIEAEAYEEPEQENPEPSAPPPPPSQKAPMPRDRIERLIARAERESGQILLSELEEFEDGYGQYLDQLPEDDREKLQAIITATRKRLLKNSNIIMAG